MTLLLTNEDRGALIAHGDDVATSLQNKWGSCYMSEPKYDETHGWHVEVFGLCGDIQMDMVRVYPNGSREMAV